MTELNPQASLGSDRRSPTSDAPASPTPLSAALQPDGVYFGLTLETWVKVAVLTPLIMAVYWLVLRWLWDKTNPISGEANWGHAICIPIVGLYYLYINRDDLMKQPVEPLLLGRFMAPWRVWPAAAMVVSGLAVYLTSGSAASTAAGALVVLGGHAAMVNGIRLPWQRPWLGVLGAGLAEACFLWAASGYRASDRITVVIGLLGALLFAVGALAWLVWSGVRKSPDWVMAGLSFWGGAVLSIFGAAVLVPALQPFTTPAAIAVLAFGVLVLALDWALASLLGGLAMFAFGIWPGQNQFVQGCAMILTLFGVVLMLGGWRVMKYAWFPIAYLICGIPWPALVYSFIASPLQELAARVAVQTLQFTGVNAYRTGTKINMGGITEPLRTLNVAEACAGLRSLMTFITVGVAVAFLSARPLWQKLIITASAIPIAIFCNVMRVAGQGLLDHYVSRQLSESFAHQFVGLVMLVPAFFMILLVGWILDHIFVEEADDDRRAAEGRLMPAPAAGGGAVGGGGGLVVDIPRKPQAPKVATVPTTAQTHVAPRAAAAATAAPAAKTAVTGAGAAPTRTPTGNVGVAPAKPVTAPAVGAKPQATPAARPKVATPQPAQPAVTPAPAPVPSRGGVVPPRPGILPPRPGAPRPPAAGAVPPPAPRPVQPKPPQQQPPQQQPPQQQSPKEGA